MSKITTVLLDIDGTLLDTKELIFAAFEFAFKTQGESIPPRTELVKVVGKPLEECYYILTGKQNIASYAKAHHDFQIANFHLSKPFTNTVEALQKLKDQSIKIAAVTSRKKHSALKTMDLAGITKYMDFSVFADEVTHHKPHPEPLLKALRALGSHPNETVMVGDSDADILGGKNAGTKTIGAMYGFHGEKLQEYCPDFLIEDIGELPEIIAMLNTI